MIPNYPFLRSIIAISVEDIFFDTLVSYKFGCIFFWKMHFATHCVLNITQHTPNLGIVVVILTAWCNQNVYKCQHTKLADIMNIWLYSNHHLLSNFLCYFVVHAVFDIHCVP